MTEIWSSRIKQDKPYQYHIIFIIIFIIIIFIIIPFMIIIVMVILIMTTKGQADRVEVSGRKVDAKLSFQQSAWPAALQDAKKVPPPHPT